MHLRPARRRFWYLAPVRSVSVRASSSTTARFTLSGRCQKLGCETVIINNNPETVSTDFDTADRLYFEPLTPEDVTGVVEAEKPDYAIVQFGGQTAINLAAHLEKLGVPILGTPAWSIDAAEDREKFDVILEKCGIRVRTGHTVMTEEEAVKAADELGYPVLVRRPTFWAVRAWRLLQGGRCP